MTAALTQRLTEAKAAREYHDGQARELKAFAAEQESPQAYSATMSHAMRHAGLAQHWQREVYSLTAQIAGQKFVAAEVILTAEQCAAVDSTIGALA